MASTAIVGTELKFNLYFKPLDNIHAVDYDFSVSVYCNKRNGSLVIPKSSCIFIDQDNYLVLVDTSTLGTGPLTFEVTAYIPDGDFDDSLRTEIVRYTTDVEVIL